MRRVQAQSANSANVTSHSLSGCAADDLWAQQVGHQTNTEMLGLFGNGPSHKYELKTLSLTNQRLSLFSIASAELELIGYSTSSIVVLAIAGGRLERDKALGQIPIFAGPPLASDPPSHVGAL